MGLIGRTADGKQYTLSLPGPDPQPPGDGISPFVTERLGYWDQQAAAIVEPDTRAEPLPLVGVKRIAFETADARERLKREALVYGRITTERSIGFLRCYGAGHEHLLLDWIPAGSSASPHALSMDPRIQKDVLRVSFMLSSLASLQELHLLRVIHRDIKPENLLILGVGQRDVDVRIIDFGHSKVEGAPSITAVGGIPGSPQWMAPEQKRGAAVSPKSDLYSLALATRYASYGLRPDDPPEAIPAGLSPAEEDFATLLRKCLSERPEDRPALDDLQKQLQRIKVRLTSGGRRPPTPDRAFVLAPTAEAYRDILQDLRQEMDPAAYTDSTAVATGVVRPTDIIDEPAPASDESANDPYIDGLARLLDMIPLPSVLSGSAQERLAVRLLIVAVVIVLLMAGASLIVTRF